MTYADLDALIAATRPPMSPEMRRRVAVHEAGHALVRILLGIGEITLITIEAAGGEAFTESIATNDIIETAGACQDYLVALMAGRAAEQVVFGSALAGSGGSIRSDLAQATKLATVAETSPGFGSRQPLIYGTLTAGRPVAAGCLCRTPGAFAAGQGGAQRSAHR